MNNNQTHKKNYFIPLPLVIIGIMIAFIGMKIGMVLFIPSANAVSFPIFLFALFVGGIGNTLLHARVNPYVTLIERFGYIFNYWR